jgi:hypothetical protein
MLSRKPTETMNVRVTVPGYGYKKHEVGATATIEGEILVVRLGDGATVEILPRLNVCRRAAATASRSRQAHPRRD